MTRNDFSKSAIGKTFKVIALNSKGRQALTDVWHDEPSDVENELVEMKSYLTNSKYFLTFYIKPAISEKIDEVSKLSMKKAHKLGIKEYNAKMQADLLRKKLTIGAVLDSIVKNLKKYGATLFDVEIEVLNEEEKLL
jgi:hypothetical protein